MMAPMTSNAGGPPSFDGDLDLAPHAPAPASAPPPGPAAQAPSAGGLALGGGIDFGGAIDLAGPPAAPQAPVERAPDAPPQIDGGLADALDLATRPERPAVPEQGGQSFFTPEPEIPPARASQRNLISDETKEKLQAAAIVAKQRAEQAAAQAAGAARDLAKRAVEVDRQPIRLDDPSTWIRPMRGPLIVFGAAIVITIVAVIANSATGSNFPIRWISLPLMLAAIGFVVYRWIMIQKE
jgi:hypothetical protein